MHSVYCLNADHYKIHTLTTNLVVRVWVLIMFGPLSPTVNYLCENETRPARLEVRGEVIIS